MYTLTIPQNTLLGEMAGGHHYQIMQNQPWKQLLRQGVTSITTSNTELTLSSMPLCLHIKSNRTVIISNSSYVLLLKAFQFCTFLLFDYSYNHHLHLCAHTTHKITFSQYTKSSFTHKNTRRFLSVPKINLISAITFPRKPIRVYLFLSYPRQSRRL